MVRIYHSDGGVEPSFEAGANVSASIEKSIFLRLAKSLPFDEIAELVVLDDTESGVCEPLLTVGESRVRTSVSASCATAGGIVAGNFVASRGTLRERQVQ